MSPAEAVAPLSCAVVVGLGRSGLGAARLLQARGHAVSGSATMGSTQSIMIDGDRFLGAADTRRPDALALGVR